MKYDVFCMQHHTYEVCMQPLETCETTARALSMRYPEPTYLVVKPDDTPVAMFRAGHRFEFVEEAANE